MTNVTEMQSKDLDNRPISVESSCQTIDVTIEMQSLNSELKCSCLCGDAVKDINCLKSKIEDLQSVVCSLESELKDQETILSLYNRAAELNEKYVKQINDSNQCISTLKEDIVKLEQERDSLQLAVKLISQEKYCSASVNKSLNEWHCPLSGNNLKRQVNNQQSNVMMKEGNNRFAFLPDEYDMSISNRAEPNNTNPQSKYSNLVIVIQIYVTIVTMNSPKHLVINWERKSRGRVRRAQIIARQLAISILISPVHLVIYRERIIKGRVRRARAEAAQVMLDQEGIYHNIDRDPTKIKMLTRELIRRLRNCMIMNVSKRIGKLSSLLAIL